MTQDHHAWLNAHKVVLKAQAFDINRVKLLAKEKLLRKEDASQSFLFKALKIKIKQSLIKLLKDDKGNAIMDPNAMATTMLTYLS